MVRIQTFLKSNFLHLYGSHHLFDEWEHQKINVRQCDVCKWKPAQVAMGTSNSICTVLGEEQMELTLKEVKFSGR